MKDFLSQSQGLNVNQELNNMPGNEVTWINPIGGLGDTLMLSGVLKLVIEQSPSRRFNLARRTNYLAILKEHPAISMVGFPPKDAKFLRVDYWSMEKLGHDNQRPFQILAREFGLSTPVEERLYIPGELKDDPLLYNFIPWKKQNIIIAPASDSPRKAIHPQIWHRLVDYLLSDGIFVIQVGRIRELHIKNAYSLRGLTTPLQLIGLIKRCDAVITSDNFIMHAAHLTSTPAVVVWGPTHHTIYGYPEQSHIQMPKMCGLGSEEDCVGPSRNEGGRLYATPCPLGKDHCLDQIKPETIYESIKKVIWLFS